MVAEITGPDARSGRCGRKQADGKGVGQVMRSPLGTTVLMAAVLAWGCSGDGGRQDPAGPGDEGPLADHVSVWMKVVRSIHIRVANWRHTMVLQYAARVLSASRTCVRPRRTCFRSGRPTVPATWTCSSAPWLGGNRCRGCRRSCLAEPKGSGRRQGQRVTMRPGRLIYAQRAPRAAETPTTDREVESWRTSGSGLRLTFSVAGRTQ